MAQSLRRANPNTIQDKLLVGYQGWFTCAGDGPPIHPGHHGWLHWCNAPLPSGGRPNTDLWPDTSAYDPAELFPVPGLTLPSGAPAHLFSSRHPATVRRHFHWMALHGVDGAFLQRFAGQCERKPGNHGVRDLRDEVGARVREAAEAEGRVFAIMYDVSGVSPDKIQNILEQDWVHLVTDQRLLDSPNYLREHGRPVVALWGFGFNGRNHTPDLVRTITDFFRSNTPGGVYLVAGTPGHWRTSSSDADKNPGFLQVWTDCFDAISPWTVGRYGNEDDAERWGQERVKADADYLKQLEEQGGRKVDYMPVVLPGGSGFNLSGGKWGMNDIRRNGGQFLWRQIYNARRAGVRIIYGAMWDEYDEGTAFMPVVSYASQLPVHPAFRFVALDIDGHDIPSDWYMRIAGFAAEALHGERTLTDTLPYKELQDYWSTRPQARPADVDGVTRAFGAWQVSGVPNDAPPPYSLEDTSVSSGGGPPPPVPKDRRPSAAVPLAAAAAAVASESTGAPRHRASLPPPVDMASRPPSSPAHAAAPTPGPVPVPPTRPYRSPTATGGPRPAPPMPPRPAYAPLNPGMPMPASTGVSGEYTEYMRGRQRSRSRSHSRSSSSGSRKKGRAAKHRHSHGHPHHPSHGHGHGHGHGLPPVGFPTPGGLSHAFSEGSGYGGPGHGHGHAHGYGGYGMAPVHAAPTGLGHAASAGPGYGYPGQYGPGPGFDGGQPPPHGYTPYPSSSSGYASYGGNAGGSGTGGVVASALQAVEGIAGRQTRNKLEKTVKTLSNSLNKRK